VSVFIQAQAYRQAHRNVEEFPTEYIDSVFVFLTPTYTYKPKSIRFRNISISTGQNLTKFSGFWGGGSPYDFESLKISGSDEGVLREGVGKRKV